MYKTSLIFKLPLISCLSIFLVNSAFANQRSTAKLWTVEIKQRCAKFSEEPELFFKLASEGIISKEITFDIALGCAWPVAINELETASKDLAQNGPGASLSLSMVSGIYQTSFQFTESSSSNTRSLDAKIARWLIAVREVRQLWPFTKKLAINKKPLTEALIQASLTSPDSWQAIWNAYTSLNCSDQISTCQKSKNKILSTLARALDEAHSSSEILALLDEKEDANLSDVALIGHENKIQHDFEILVGNFTGDGNQFYFINRGDGTLFQSERKWLELKTWFLRDQIDLNFPIGSGIPIGSSACENLEQAFKFLSELNSGGSFQPFTGTSLNCSMINGAVRFTNRSFLERLENNSSLLRASTLYLRKNLVEIFSPSALSEQTLSRMLLTHQLRSIRELAKQLSRPEIQRTLNLARSAERPLKGVVELMLNSLKVSIESLPKDDE